MEEQKHSPLPWVLSDLGPCDGLQITASDGTLVVADTDDVPDNDRHFILRACNSHHELVEAVKALLGDLSDMERVITDEGDYFRCRHCGRNYSVKNHPRTALECSDDCAGHIARAALAKATGGDK